MYSATKQDGTHTSEMSTYTYFYCDILYTLCLLRHVIDTHSTVVPGEGDTPVLNAVLTQSNSMACLHVHCQTCVLALSKHIMPLTLYYHLIVYSGTLRTVFENDYLQKMQCIITT